MAKKKAKPKAPASKPTKAKAGSKAKPGAKKAPKYKMKRGNLPKNENGVVLLSGGNPQVAKGYGDAPVQAYIAAMPGWKSAVGRRLDELIVRTIPDVQKAVKWNSPMYGVEQGSWFLGIHVFAKYIKVAFFNGAMLRPLPPGESKQPKVRYLNIHEDDKLDEAQFVDWVKQASELPGEKM